MGGPCPKQVVETGGGFPVNKHYRSKDVRFNALLCAPFPARINGHGSLKHRGTFRRELVKCGVTMVQCRFAFHDAAEDRKPTASGG